MNFKKLILELETLRESQLMLGKNLCTPGPFYPLDLFAISSINRSVALHSGFLILLKNKNFVCAAPLVRMELDTLMRFYASTLVDNPHDFALKVFNGIPIKSIKDRNNNKMSDKYLKDLLSAHYPWISSIYEETSGYIHFSDKHFFNAINAYDDSGRIQMKISESDSWIPKEIYIEAVVTFSQITKIFIDFIRTWISQRR